MKETNRTIERHSGLLKRRPVMRLAVAACLIGGGVASQAHATPVTNGLELWLKADAGVTTGAGGSVTAWADQSSGGTAYSLTQNDTAKQPQLINTWTEGNGKPAVLFDGVDDYLTDSVNSLDLTNALSIFIVAYNNDQSNYNGLFKVATSAGVEDGSSNLELYWNRGGDLLYMTNRGGDSGSQTYRVAEDSPPGPDALYLLDLLVGDGSTDLRTNGVTRISSDSNILPGAAGAPAVGVGYFGTGDNTLNGYIGEVLIYNRKVTGSERDEIYDYLEARFVPEPGTAALLAVSAGLLLGRRRRRSGIQPT